MKTTFKTIEELVEFAFKELEYIGDGSVDLSEYTNEKREGDGSTYITPTSYSIGVIHGLAIASKFDDFEAANTIELALYGDACFYPIPEGNPKIPLLSWRD